MEDADSGCGIKIKFVDPYMTVFTPGKYFSRKDGERIRNGSCLAWLEYEFPNELFPERGNSAGVPTLEAFLKSEEYKKEHPGETVNLDDELIFKASNDGYFEFLPEIRTAPSMWQYFRETVGSLYAGMKESDWLSIDKHMVQVGLQV